MRVLYLDLNNSGISGDMFLASLLGLVPDNEVILKKLENLKNHLSGVSRLELKLLKTEHSGIQLNQLKINIYETKDHRTAITLQNALKSFLIDSNLSKGGKNYTIHVLDSLIQAEADVHGDLIEKIHLHELSSVDTLIDIVGVALSLDCLEYFNGNFKIFCSKIPLGGGKVQTSHGILSVPAPATVKILEKSNLVSFGGPIESELVTPTGAALLANLNPQFHQYLPEMNILKSINSTGQKKFKNFSNILRIFYGESNGLSSLNLEHYLHKYVEQISILETDVDDVSGEILGSLLETLYKKKNALDVQIIPTITKKNRPGHIIKVICYPKQTFELIETILHELGTLGVRFSIINRVCIERKTETRSIELNDENYEVRFKVSFTESDVGKDMINIKPEYEDLKKISRKSGLPIKKVQLLVQSEIKKIFLDYEK